AGGWNRRADPHRGLSQRGADMVAERPRHHVLPRPRGGWRADAVYGGRERPQRATPEDAELRVRSGLVATVAVTTRSRAKRRRGTRGAAKAPHSPHINHRERFPLFLRA